MPSGLKCGARIVLGSILVVVLILSYPYISTDSVRGANPRRSQPRPAIQEESLGVRSYESPSVRSRSRNELSSGVRRSHEFISVNTEVSKPWSQSQVTSSSDLNIVTDHSNLESNIFNIQCQKWAVVAPLDSEWASEAVRRQVRMHESLYLTESHQRLMTRGGLLGRVGTQWSLC